MGTVIPKHIRNDFELSEFLDGLGASYLVYADNGNGLDRGGFGYWHVAGDGVRVGTRRPYPAHQVGWIATSVETGQNFTIAEGDDRPAGFKWDDAVASTGEPGDVWGQFKGGYRVWVTAETAERLGFVRSKFHWGTPCTDFRCDRVNSTGDPDGLCKMHRNAIAKHEKWEADFKAKRAEIRDEREHANQTLRSAEETLDRISPILERLGLRPDTFTATSQGIVGPAESIEMLATMADAFAEFESGMGSTG